MYYVSMIDRVLSGWGKSEGRDNVMIFECDTMYKAHVVAANARARRDQAKVAVWSRSPYPYFPEECCFVQTKTKEDYPHWYIAGYFSREEVK